MRRLFIPLRALVFTILMVVDAVAGPQICAVTPEVDADLLPRPFSPRSVWNRRIPDSAVYSDVSDAIFGNPRTAPARVVPDIVTVAYVKPNAPLVRIEKNAGWKYPARATSTGQLLFQRHLPRNACVGVSWNRDGNALFSIIDMATGLADDGVGGWRCPGMPILSLHSDSPHAHNIDVVNGDGLSGYSRGSGLPSLGGALRIGELARGPKHALAILMPHRRYSARRHYVWPAHAADQIADNPVFGYAGPDPNYTMGVLLAIPRSAKIDSIAWATPQGRALAINAQKFGWYIVDSVGQDQTIMGIAVETRAAVRDLGLSIDPDTNQQTVDPSILDAEGFNADVMTIAHLLQAVISNAP